MEPELKARELIIKFQFSKPPLQFDKAKQCALICITELMESTPMYTGNLNPKWKYYSEVKTEIEKL